MLQLLLDQSGLGQDRVITYWQGEMSPCCRAPTETPPRPAESEPTQRHKETKTFVHQKSDFFGLLIKLCKKLNQKSECGSYSTNLTWKKQTGLNRSRLGRYIGFLLSALRWSVSVSSINSTSLQASYSQEKAASAAAGPVRSGPVRSGSVLLEESVNQGKVWSELTARTELSSFFCLEIQNTELLI